MAEGTGKIRIPTVILAQVTLKEGANIRDMARMIRASITMHDLVEEVALSSNFHPDPLNLPNAEEIK